MAKYKVSYRQTHEEVVHVKYLVTGFVEADSLEEVERLIENEEISDAMADNGSLSLKEIDREGVDTLDQFEIKDPEVSCES